MPQVCASGVCLRCIDRMTAELPTGWGGRHGMGWPAQRLNDAGIPGKPSITTGAMIPPESEKPKSSHEN